MVAIVRTNANVQCAQPLTAMDRLCQEAPYLPRCSGNKTASLIRPLEYALSYPYMQVNRAHMVSWLIFDLDHDHLTKPNPYIWDENGLPPPNMIVRDPASNKAHLYYALSPVCTSENARSKPIQYMKAVYRAMALVLESDLDYSGPVAKTPHHPNWLTTELHAQEYSLDELSDYVELESQAPTWAVKEQPDTSHSRNCTLFEDVRRYAYGIVNQEREKGTFQHFVARLSSYAESKNSFILKGFSSNLSNSEVRATVKSVSRWTWDHYTGRRDCNRGVMALTDSDLCLAERQALAAKRTHLEKKQKSLVAVTKAVRWLIERSEKVSFSSIAKYAQLTRQTVAKYAEHIEALLQHECSIIPLASLFNNKKRVNFAVHQISGSLSGDAVTVEEGANEGVTDSRLVDTRSAQSFKNST